MTPAKGSLAATHGRLWYDDPVYRASWIVGPQFLVVIALCWLFGGSLPMTSAPWGQPADPSAVDKEVLALKDQAKTDRGAMARLESIAAAGNTTANLQLGYLYDPVLKWSKVAPPDIDKSMAYYWTAVQGGNSDAQHLLVDFLNDPKYGRSDWIKKCNAASAQTNNPTGVVLRVRGECYNGGWGNNAKNPVLAVAAYQAASAKGELTAMAGLGYYYINGLGNLPKDIETGIRLYKQSAEGNAPLGLNNLASCYDSGCGSLQRNPAEAARLIALALDARYSFTINILSNRPEVYSSQFWTELQGQLANRNLYNGPRDGKPNPALLDVIKGLGR
jgi:hypothetical protein